MISCFFVFFSISQCCFQFLMKTQLHPSILELFILIFYHWFGGWFGGPLWRGHNGQLTLYFLCRVIYCYDMIIFQKENFICFENISNRHCITRKSIRPFSDFQNRITLNDMQFLHFSFQFHKSIKQKVPSSLNFTFVKLKE